MSPEYPPLEMRRIVQNLTISFVTGNKMATGLTSFMDGYKNFMETKSGEFCVNRRILDAGKWLAESF
jgi:hypothetical protein